MKRQYVYRAWIIWCVVHGLVSWHAWSDEQVSLSAGETISPAAETKEPSARAFELSDDVLRSIVTIRGTRGAGTGFIAAHGGRTSLYTNIHVLMGNSNVRFMNHRGEMFQPTAMEAAVDRDLVRLTLRRVPEHCLVIEAPGRVNELVAVCGNAEGEDVMRMLYGRVVGIGPQKVETDALFVRGHSGSPIVTREGRVIGIATYVKRGNADWVSTNTPFAVVRRFGYRVDNVSRWIKVDPARFLKESQWLCDQEEKLAAVAALLEIWAQDPYWQPLPEEHAGAVHRGIGDWVRSHNTFVASNRRRLHTARPSATKASELSRELQQLLRREGDLLKDTLCSVGKMPTTRWHLPFFTAYAQDLNEWHEAMLTAIDMLITLHCSYDPVIIKSRAAP